MDKKQVTDLRSELLDSRFGAKSISTIAESKRFPLHEMRDDVAFQIINDELYLDGNARQNLATFCQTWDDENVHKLMDLSINKNWIDKEEYPQSAAIDLRCVNMVADLWHAPAPVSYTHLDVYKRQAVCVVAASKWTLLNCCWKTTKPP